MTRKRFAVSLAAACLLAPLLSAQEFSLKAFGGARLSPGGDLNAAIRGWRDDYADRSSSSFSSTFDWPEMKAALEAGVEFEAAFSPHLSLGLSVGVMPGAAAGMISTEFAALETTALSASETKTLSVEENTSRRPRAELTAVPVLLTAYYCFTPGARLSFIFGAGAGAYFGRYSYSETYEHEFRSVEDLLSAGTTSRYIDRSSTAGDYLEEAQNTSWGVHAVVGLEYRLADNLGVTLEVLGRRVMEKPWKGSKTDDYEWSRTWGPWGAFSDSGETAESFEGELWRTAAVSDATGKAYPRLILSETPPAGSGYASARRAELGLSGVTVRVGLRLRFGGRR